MPATTRLALPYPAASDSPNGPAQIQALANALDNAAIDLAEGTLAARPAPSIRGRWYYATDVAVLYRDSGSTWRAVSLTDDSVTQARIAADAVGNSELAPDAVTNVEVAAGAAIAKSKLANLDIVDADVDAGAAIAKSKLAALNIGNADVAAAAAIAESKLNLASDAAAGTASRRSLGSGATQAAPGNDARLSDQRVPTDGSVSYAKLAAAVAALLPSGIVSALPGSPVDGQVINYQTAAMLAQNVVWRLRYHSSESQWECIGGGFLRGTAGGSSFSGLGGGFNYGAAALAVPLGGDYETWVYGECTETNISFASILFGVGADLTATVYKEMGSAPVVDAVAIPFTGFRSDCSWAVAAQLRGFIASPGWVMNGSHGAWIVGIRPTWVA